MNRYVIVAILVIASMVLIYLLAKPGEISTFEQDRLRDLTTSADKTKKVEAMQDLGDSGKQEYIPKIMKYVNDPDPQVSKSAVSQTIKLNPEQGPVILQKELAPIFAKDKLTSGEMEKVKTFIEQTAAYRNQAHKPMLKKLLDNPNDFIAVTAGQFLIKEYSDLDKENNTRKIEPDVLAAMDRLADKLIGEWKNSGKKLCSPELALLVVILCKEYVSDPEVIPILEKIRDAGQKPPFQVRLEQTLKRLKEQQQNVAN